MDGHGHFCTVLHHRTTYDSNFAPTLAAIDRRMRPCLLQACDKKERSRSIRAAPSPLLAPIAPLTPSVLAAGYCTRTLCPTVVYYRSSGDYGSILREIEIRTRHWAFQRGCDSRIGDDAGLEIQRVWVRDIVQWRYRLETTNVLLPPPPTVSLAPYLFVHWTPVISIIESCVSMGAVLREWVLPDRQLNQNHIIESVVFKWVFMKLRF